MAYARFAEELPPDSDRIKSSVVQKMTSVSEVWVDREMVLTLANVYIAKIGKDVASETIKLHQVERVTTISKALSAAANDGGPIGKTNSGQQTAFAFQVFMLEEAAPGDRSYSFRTTSQKDSLEWVLASHCIAGTLNPGTA